MLILLLALIPTFLAATEITTGFLLGPNMKHRRAYHSAAILLPDGSVIMGGDPNGGTTPNERYRPSYFFKPRHVGVLARDADDETVLRPTQGNVGDAAFLLILDLSYTLEPASSA